MSIKGFNINGEIERYDYNALDNLPEDSGTIDYTDLTNKPQINGVTLQGNKTTEQLGLAPLDEFDDLTEDVVDLKSTVDLITPEMFGAIGDGVTDDTTAIQDCIDYAYENQIYYLFLPHGKYLISSPLKIYFSYNDFWAGKGITIRGRHQGSTEIVKTGNATYKDEDTVFYCECGDTDKSGGSGCSIFDLTITNQSTSDNAWCISGDAFVRGQFKRLNLKGKNGINCPQGYCNEFDDIIGRLSGTVLVDGGTSTLVGKIGCFGAHNPYKLSSRYSNYNLLFGDNCTGTFVTINPFGSCHISVIGTESPNLDCVVELGSNSNTAQTRSILIDTINCDNLANTDSKYIIVKECTATVNNINIIYQHTVAQNTLVYFSSTYGSLNLGSVSPMSNATQYQKDKLLFADNQGGRNILHVSSKEENAFIRGELVCLGGSQFYNSIYETERAHNVHSVVMGGNYNGTGIYGEYKRQNGTDTYRWDIMPPAGSLILSDISKATTGFAGFISLETGSSYGNTVANKAPIPTLFVCTEGDVPEVARKNGTMLFDTSSLTLKVYYNNQWRPAVTAT